MVQQDIATASGSKGLFFLVSETATHLPSHLTNMLWPQDSPCLHEVPIPISGSLLPTHTSLVTFLASFPSNSVKKFNNHISDFLPSELNKCTESRGVLSRGAPDPKQDL